MIKFLDLHQINQRFQKEFEKKFQDFLSSGQYVLGEEVLAFEKEYANFCGTMHCIGVSSGLDALYLIIEAYKLLGKLSEGDEVLVPANTYIASILAVSQKGLVPILVEPSLKTYNIDVECIEAHITKKTKAILGVHLYGNLYDVDVLEQIAKRHDLILIEDAAQAHGAVHKDGRKAGNVSDVAAFSFYPSKNLGALGEAGAITTNNAALAEVIFKLRNYGRINSYENIYKGFNNRIDALQTAFLRIKLKQLDLDNLKRQQIANYYLNQIDASSITLPSIKKLESHVFHLFVIRSKDRNKLKETLLKEGIETAIHYPIPIHKQKAYSEFSNLSLPITEQIHKEVLSIPLNPILSEDEIKKIVFTLKKYS
ncbi:DegT/DnrJ/EryC1/StrS family aminotransferase [Tamlana fucoidanivorans]|uniref:DegT/DnrJ/EryC1/StrS family aminotransferase n=1 Tax=Allotamlana fucoidanivorans TaxID=2583814 RepID=A0A5C4SIM6_9FLAO|nr:DegT/DnrJ/EryC1/StrS family aminotransferase [Tamlana fucoidanivorans]TNJ43584.1 DegT/DnrJ/EryC1/StrS family aminotransferase [Tamlana fucoidanivorans]